MSRDDPTVECSQIPKDKCRAWFGKCVSEFSSAIFTVIAPVTEISNLTFIRKAECLVCRE